MTIRSIWRNPAEVNIGRAYTDRTWERVCGIFGMLSSSVGMGSEGTDSEGKWAAKKAEAR